MFESWAKHALPQLTLFLALALSGWAAIAAMTESVSAPTASAPEAKNWRAALDAFNKVVATDPGNANAHNFLGYAYRKSGKLDLAFKHYEEALRLDPKHRGAHEYLGEAYLMVNNLAKAEEHLKVLDRLCLFGCEEYDDLKKAVAEFRQKAASK